MARFLDICIENIISQDEDSLGRALPVKLMALHHVPTWLLLSNSGWLNSG